MEINIQLGMTNDIDELEQLYNDLNVHLAENINYPGWIKGVYPIREDASAGIAKHHLYVAKYHGQIVGSIILSHEPEQAYQDAPWECNSDYSKIFVIHTFAVHPNYLQHGIGRQLMEFSIKRGKELNYTSIRLDVYEKNLPAMKLYEKYGFQYIDTVDLGLGNHGLNWFKLYEKVL